MADDFKSVNIIEFLQKHADCRTETTITDNNSPITTIWKEFCKYLSLVPYVSATC